MAPDSRNTASAPVVSILIVSWNARDLLARCLESLAPLPYQVVVVDNASGDGSADLIASRFPSVTLVRSPENLGFAGGVNRARREATADRLLLLNPDTTATRDAIDTLAVALDADGTMAGDAASPRRPRADQRFAHATSTETAAPGTVPTRTAAVTAPPDADAAPVGAVGGRLISPDGTHQTGFNVRRFPTLASFAAELLLLHQLWPGNPVTRRYLAADLDPDTAADVDQPAAACLMVRADVFDAVGGMDTRFHPAWFEDVDLCRRIRAAGYRIRYEPRAAFAHHGGVAMRTLGLGRFATIWYANLERYVAKHHGTAAWLAIKPLIALGMVLRAAIAFVRGDRTAAGAYAAVLRQTLARWSP